MQATMVKFDQTQLLFKIREILTFHLAGQPIPITKCYTYLGIPFDKSLSLKSIIKLLNTKLPKFSFLFVNFLSNSKIPIPF